MGGDTGSGRSSSSMLAVTLGGIFIVSALIGVISTGVDAKLDELRKGRSFVLESDHTLILGWSDDDLHDHRRARDRQREREEPVVVVLADHDKVEMEDAIRAKVGDTGGTRMVCRTRQPDRPRRPRDRQPAARRARSSSSSPEDDEPDAEVIKTLLAITQHPSRATASRTTSSPRSRTPRTSRRPGSCGGDEAVLIDKRRADRAAHRPDLRASRALSVVYTELLDFGGDEIYFRQDPSLAGKTFGDALLAFEDCSVIGIRHGRRRSRLNPPMDTPIGPGDQLIAIAEDDETIEREAASPARPTRPHRRARPRADGGRADAPARLERRARRP